MSDDKKGQTLEELQSAGWKPVEEAPSQGYWEDRGIAGKVWHPSSGASELHRVDNQLLGLPPEAAVLSGLGVGRAMAGPGMTAAQRIMAGASNAAGQGAAMVKYQATKTVLQKMGVPEVIAAPVAAAVSGMSKNKSTASTTAERMPSGTRTIDAGTATAVPMEAAPMAPASAAAMPPASAPSVAATAPKLALTVDESKELMRLTSKGMPLSDALKSIAAGRALRQSTSFAGLPTSIAADAAAAARNQSGSW